MDVSAQVADLTARAETLVRNETEVRAALPIVELVSDDLTRILSGKLANFQVHSVNLSTRSSFERTDRTVNIGRYYTSWPIKFGILEGWQKSVKSSATSSRCSGEQVS